MVPAFTLCPANLFTPSRLPWLSRPLRLVPPPFLCAICCYLFFPAAGPLHWFGFLRPRWKYLVYAQSGEKLAVPVLTAIANLGLVLKNNDLLALAIPLRCSHYLRPVDDWFADRHLVTIGNKQHPVQFDSTALSHIQMLRIYGLPFGYSILLAASFNNSVNFKPPKR
jgi:hypothetical protein